MPILEIKIYPDKILRKKALDIKNITEDIKALGFDMIETMRAKAGIGLAGPQVGVNKRIIVIEKVESSPAPLILINPKILKKRGRSSFCEGCLSVPEITCDIIRPKEVSVEALNIDGQTLNIKAGGILARVLQHEIDHLDGILFLDKVRFFKRRKILKDINSKACVEL